MGGSWVRCWVSEGTGLPCVGLVCCLSRPAGVRTASIPCVGLGLAVPGLVVGLLFEICIVDASIFFLGFLCVSFQGRMVDALVPGADEGRGRLR